MLGEEEKTLIAPAPSAEGLARMRHKTPPPGRPPGSVTIAEMIERITVEVKTEVTEGSRADLEAEIAKLRADLRGQVKVSTNFVVGGLALNAVAIVAMFAFSRWWPGLVVGVAIAGLGGCVVGIARASTRPDRPRARSVTARTA
jgi:hypothetical protein